MGTLEVVVTVVLITTLVKDLSGSHTKLDNTPFPTPSFPRLSPSLFLSFPPFLSPPPPPSLPPLLPALSLFIHLSLLSSPLSPLPFFPLSLPSFPLLLSISLQVTYFLLRKHQLESWEGIEYSNSYSVPKRVEL